jgi:hypothetical protein
VNEELKEETPSITFEDYERLMQQLEADQRIDQL